MLELSHSAQDASYICANPEHSQKKGFVLSLNASRAQRILNFEPGSRPGIDQIENPLANVTVVPPSPPAPEVRLKAIANSETGDLKGTLGSRLETLPNSTADKPEEAGEKYMIEGNDRFIKHLKIRPPETLLDYASGLYSPTAYKKWLTTEQGRKMLNELVEGIDDRASEVQLTRNYFAELAYGRYEEQAKTKAPRPDNS